MQSLESLLVEYSDSDYYGFHMPGHKRNVKKFGDTIPYAIDITEIEGFDDLHHPEDILLHAKEKCARLFGAEESFYLINGSTAGNLSAILSVTEPGDKILMARNNHKSVYNAVFLNHLNPVYIYPQWNKLHGITEAVSRDEIQNILEEQKDIRAVVIVSPTYDGVISDVKGIAEVAHAYGIPLIVDEAHGAHLGMHEYFPGNSNECGADLVVHSVHKTLPSLTQTGVLHVNGNLVNREKLRRYLKMLQSSSPSYVLMSSIDSCVNMLMSNQAALFAEYVDMLEKARGQLKEMKHLCLIETEAYDRSKILIGTDRCERAGLSSQMLYKRLLEEFHLQMEMCGANYVTAMTSIGDTKEGFHRLVEALRAIDKDIDVLITNPCETNENIDAQQGCQSVVRERVDFPIMKQAGDGCQGSKWFYYIYPPGIPFVVPGEMITDEVSNLMKSYIDKGFVIHKG